ncbi:MAG: two-component system nitrogen regulation sensor histidine kinase NtrY [Paraglaciecola sp.]|jgi:two-component system nitrogen regulation sensor histidine kinase NtrY
MFKNFKANITSRILFLIGMVLALVYCVAKTEFYITMFILVVLIVLTVVDMVRYVDKTNQDFTAFLLGIKYEDFSATYSGHHKGRTFGEMYVAFNQINQKFLNIKAEKEANHQYMQTIVQHISIGLLVLDAEGNIFLMNKALQGLIQKPYLVNVEALKGINPLLFEVVNKLKTGDKELLKISINNNLLHLAIEAREFKLRDQSLKLLSFQNIQSELEEQELEAWQKLIRILRHEIMNSITPIVSLTSTIETMIGDGTEELDEETMQDIKDGLGAIQKRSEGLMHFTETYRNLTRLPPPVFKAVDARHLIERIYTLFKPLTNKYQIDFNIQLPSTAVTFDADAELMEQVLINLLKNAIEALKVKEADKKVIVISAQKSMEGLVTIDVSDNGIGIEQKVLEQMFVPFYTTKNEGSGIGLNLSRQIVRMHKGRISVRSEVGEGSVFTLAI